MNLSEIILGKIKRDHQGKENAITRKELLSYCNQLANNRYPDFWDFLTDRQLRNIYCQLPVATCNAGIFWPIRKEELYEFQTYLKKKAIPLFNRYKMVAKEHRNLMDYGDIIQWELF